MVPEGATGRPRAGCAPGMGFAKVGGWPRRVLRPRERPRGSTHEARLVAEAVHRRVAGSLQRREPDPQGPAQDGEGRVVARAPGRVPGTLAGDPGAGGPAREDLREAG